MVDCPVLDGRVLEGYSSTSDTINDEGEMTRGSVGIIY